MTDTELRARLHILWHALGWQFVGPGKLHGGRRHIAKPYRRYYVSDGDEPALLALERDGMLDRRRMRPEYPGNCWLVTERGETWAREHLLAELAKLAKEKR